VFTFRGAGAKRKHGDPNRAVETLGFFFEKRGVITNLAKE
jgi:hypothetical protein